MKRNKNKLKRRDFFKWIVKSVVITLILPSVIKKRIFASIPEGWELGDWILACYYYRYCQLACSTYVTYCLYYMGFEEYPGMNVLPMRNDYTWWSDVALGSQQVGDIVTVWTGEAWHCGIISTVYANGTVDIWHSSAGRDATLSEERHLDWGYWSNELIIKRYNYY